MDISTILSARECRTHCLQHPFIAGKSHPTLTGHDMVPYPNRKLSRVSAGSFHISPKFLLEQCRYTSSTGSVGWSGQAMANHDFHSPSIHRTSGFGFMTAIAKSDRDWHLSGWQ